jgi:AcrR family transcriptional regulator
MRDNPEIRREQILDEAIRIVGERGYYGFTVQELAQRCGLSNAGLLYHFGSKDQLLLEMLQEFERRETEVLTPLTALAAREAAPSESSGKALLDLLRTMVLRASTQPEMGRLYMVLQSETLDPAHPAHEGFRGREAITLNLFAKLVAPYVAEPRSSARQLLALMDGLAQQWVREDQGFDLIDEWDRALATVLPKLAGRTTGSAQPAKRGSASPRAPRPSTR